MKEGEEACDGKDEVYGRWKGEEGNKRDERTEEEFGTSEVEIKEGMGKKRRKRRDGSR